MGMKISVILVEKFLLVEICKKNLWRFVKKKINFYDAVLLLGDVILGGNGNL